MNKKTFLTKLSQVTQTPYHECERMLDAGLAILTEALIRRERIFFRRFFVMEAYRAKGRKARNVNMGTPMWVPSQWRVRLSISDDLSNVINKALDSHSGIEVEFPTESKESGRRSTR